MKLSSQSSNPRRKSDKRSNGSLSTIVGDDFQGGTYVLRMRVRYPQKLAFGRFKDGKNISVSEGEYLYVGSALNERGATSLGQRLLRHATRTAGQRPHTIREEMIRYFASIGLRQAKSGPPQVKTLRWQVDHLLDRMQVDLGAVYAIRSRVRLEAEVGQMLVRDPRTVVFEPGLGASDIPGNTHLLRVDVDENWWQALPDKLLSLATGKA